MAIHNPYKKYDKGMDDAYLGYEPQNTDSKSYMTGYEYAQFLLHEPDEQQEQGEQSQQTQLKTIKE